MVGSGGLSSSNHCLCRVITLYASFPRHRIQATGTAPTVLDLELVPQGCKELFGQSIDLHNIFILFQSISNSNKSVHSDFSRMNAYTSAINFTCSVLARIAQYTIALIVKRLTTSVTCYLHDDSHWKLQ